MEKETGAERLVENLLEDANERLHYQQEFSIGGFKTLILINGGAVIALLTYAGHNSDSVLATQWSGAFLAYIAGLVSAVLAYLAGYLSQASFMQESMLRAYQLLGLDAHSGKSEEDYRKSGNRAVTIGVVLCMMSLAAFVLGSWCAMSAMS